MSVAPPVAAAEVRTRFRAQIVRGAALHAGDGVVVAVSGGRDSMVLLHLLRFTDGLPKLRLVAAHLDHAMRLHSGADADWVAGVCAAWGLPYRARRCDPAPTTEAAARRLRYDFLEEVRAAEGARVVVTAHHADDQAETVLFRAVRGTGIGGLAGIRARRSPGVWRPLLPFTRAELAAYAAEVGLSWRDDPTNAVTAVGPAPARNVLRGRILPELEERVAPGAGRALAALARRARENEGAWRSLLPGLLEGIDVRAEGNGLSVDRDALLACHPGVRARLLRALSRRLGARPGEAGTRAAVEFTSSGSSGTGVILARGLELRRELGRFVLGPGPDTVADSALGIPGSEAGDGEVMVGGRGYTVSWGPERSTDPWSETFAVAELGFPLTVRGWRPGDRARLVYGSKKLKKLLLEARVPPGERHRLPVLVDGAGAVLWVPGVVRSTDATPTGADGLLHIGIRNAQSH